MAIHYVPPISVTSQRLILDNEKLRRANAKVTTATAYKCGDLLTLSAANVLTHATDESTWDVICGQNVTAAEATIKAADGIEIPVYFGGVFNIEAVSLNGTLLTTAQYDAARAKATKNKIELSKV
ncbi:hypothetical protein [Acinetobacter terrae]|uniref:Head decoration protein n=1 Tax=Acinetobacter terrae TaxID=2731247 RepID=A0ABX1UZQ3_9GAMM|nr:hypothetical protein [Acinetobacter terrae]NNH86243.1 hypothetical protein [Acinetobacter terrae]